jgi:hypothetical protein
MAYSFVSSQPCAVVAVWCRAELVPRVTTAAGDSQPCNPYPGTTRSVTHAGFKKSQIKCYREGKVCKTFHIVEVVLLAASESGKLASG